MYTGGATSSGSGRVKRLDPLRGPARFCVPDETTDDRVRQVELLHDRIIVTRALRGMLIRVSVPIAAFRGVALEVEPGQGTAVKIALVHRDAALSIPLFAADDADDVLAEWHLWGRRFGLPMLVAGADGIWRDAFPHLGAVRVGSAHLRRRRGALRQRRPSILMRRKPGRPGARVIHRETELIARS